MQKISIKSLELLKFDMDYFRLAAKRCVASEFESSGQKLTAKKYSISGASVLSYANNGKLPDINTAIKILKKDFPVDKTISEASQVQQ